MFKKSNRVIIRIIIHENLHNAKENVSLISVFFDCILKDLLANLVTVLFACLVSLQPYTKSYIIAVI